ncbi:MAG: archaemetzincin family Zn-dependent metalloprotease [Planctomycetota bacterium]|jgi:archaemetzincin|nr:archaemetzincin family Zn-dependent metalloprotease [Planctomycetota bacterium]
MKRTVPIQSLAILPIGKFDESILPQLTQHLKKVFQVEVETLPYIPRPLDAYDQETLQYSAPRILERIETERPEKSVALLGIFDQDLSLEGLHYTFGHGSPRLRCAVISLTRLKEIFWGEEENRELFLNRVRTEATHEIGQLLGLSYCNKNTCVMYFSNGIAETDRKIDEFCAECDQIRQALLQPVPGR